MENKIINYINQTPENTNPSVLATLLGELKVPKPLTYDYMPEGYPTKSVQTTTLMEEQELAFTLSNGFYMAPITSALELVVGQTYTVNWDGTEYECVGAVFNSMPILGNLSIVGEGDDTGEPFVYGYNTKLHSGIFATLDTAASHTISVKTVTEVITPMAYDYMPEGYPKKTLRTVTLMAEQEVAFAFDSKKGVYAARLTEAPAIAKGQTYTVNWDGTEYECVCGINRSNPYLGNLSIVGAGDDTGVPFIYNGSEAGGGFATLDTSASHTISVKRIEETVTPMAEEFIPDTGKNTTTVFYL